MTPTRESQQHTEHTTGNWYDFPSWYDILHAQGTADEVTGLARIASRHCDTPVYRRTRQSDAHRPHWMEPACGSGRYLRVAAGRGCRVTGIDVNRAMIRYARESFGRRGLAGRFIEGDIAEKIPGRPADFAFCLINSVRHLQSDADLLRHLDCIHRSLKPGGVYALGIGLTQYGVEMPSEDVWTGRRGRCRVTQVVQYLPATRRRRVELAVSHLTVTTPTSERHVDTVYELRSYDLAQWLRVLRACPLELEAVVDERGRTLDGGPEATVHGYGVYVLKRPRLRNR